MVVWVGSTTVSCSLHLQLLSMIRMIGTTNAGRCAMALRGMIVPKSVTMGTAPHPFDDPKLPLSVD